MTQPRDYQFTATLFGRPIRPFHFAVMLATATIAVSLWFPVSTRLGPDRWTGLTQLVLGGAAAGSVVLLAAGWWWRRPTWDQWGLLLSVAVWVSRSVFVLITDTVVGRPQLSAILSGAWAVGAAGAYLLERHDPTTSGSESGRDE